MAQTLAQRLGTVHATSASGIREELLEACRLATETSLAVFIRPTPDANGLTRYQDFTVTGDAEARALFSRFDGMPMQSGSVVDTGRGVMSARRGEWSFSSPDRRHINHFTLLADDMNMEQMKQTGTYREMYGPLEIVDHARLFAVDGRRVLAWFGVMNRAAQGQISAQSLRELNAAAAQVVAAIRSADAMDRWAGGSGFASFYANGHCEAATANMEQWWTAADRQRLSAFVRVLDQKPENPNYLTIRGAAIRFVRMDGEGQVRYLATVDASVIRVSFLAQFGARRRRTAELAVLGMTNREIAAEMRLSPNTIKTNLSYVYDALGVSNRAELVRRVNEEERKQAVNPVPVLAGEL